MQEYFLALSINNDSRKHKMQRSFTLKEFSEGWKKAKERTSSGPSGLHFGHYKVGSQTEELNTILWQMAKIPMEKGYSPKRWCRATDVCLRKKVGVSRVDKTRIIVLYEADFNFINKWIGKTMMNIAERNQDLAEEQFGSRNAKSAISQVLNKKIIFDIGLLESP